MSTYAFNRAERYAAFTVHREVCWLCSEPVGIVDMQFDHIVPEHLEGKSELAAVKQTLGLPGKFRINGFENWMPAHPQCNRTKGGHVFKPTPLIQGYLERAARKADEAARLRVKYASDRRIDLAIDTLLHADEQRKLSPEQRERMQELAALHDSNRAPQDRGRPLLLRPGLTVVSDAGHMLLLRGPTGMVGGRPKGDHIHPSWDCINCGVTGWNGARCVICRMMDDD
jgi:hypothetical protein